MTAIVFQNLSNVFSSSVPILYDNDQQGPGSLLLLDFSLDSCWNNGVPRNLAANTATQLTGNALHPTLGGKLANIRRLNNMLGLGAEHARLEAPTVLTDYCVNKNIAFCVYARFVNNQSMIEWSPGAVVTLGQIVYIGTNIYTVTVAGTLGSTAPTTLGGTEVNGTATLTAGVTYTSTPTYGTLNPAGFFGLSQGSGYPMSYAIATTSSQTQFGGTGVPYINRSKVNQLTYSPAGGVVNRTPQAQARQITSTQVPSTPSSLALTLKAETFNFAGLYNATAGVAPANTAGLWLEYSRIHVVDLDVQGMTLAQFSAAEAAFYSSYHPLSSLLA